MKLRFSAMLFLAMAGSTAVQAQDRFPAKPISLIIAGGPGTTLDTTVRLFVAAITQKPGVQMVIDYKGGAGGTIGSAFVAKAPPDGHTIMGTISSYSISPSLYPDLSYDPLKDLAPVTQMTEYFLIMTVNPALPFKNLAEYLEHVRANPGKLNFGTSGQGSSYHMAGSLLHYLTKTHVTFIHYKTGTQRSVDFLAGRLNAQFATPKSYYAEIKAGKARGLGITALTRQSYLPDMPTLAEQGVPGYEYSGWNGILAPGRTPVAVVNELHKLFLDAGKEDSVGKKLAGVDQAVLTNTPEQFGKRLAVEIPRWREVIKAANIKLDQ
jgi:tripartite-type tricarboxylate transporter receptor subunit TctC